MKISDDVIKNPKKLEMRLEQKINGKAHRIAGHNYYERCYSHSSFKQWKLSTPMRELDELSESNEYLFQHRFNFDVSESQRKLVIAAKTAFEATDKEIKSLWLSGILNIGKNNIFLTASRSTFIVGFLFIVSSFFIIGFGLMILMTPSFFKIAPSLYYFIGLALLYLYVGYLFSFKPLSIMKRRGIKLGEKWSLFKC